MAVELKLSKSNNSTPWGFRLVGGAQFDQPLVVVKVNDDSIAENAGLEEGDLVVRINDTPTAGITHTEAHDLLVAAGLDLVLGVRKGEINMNNVVNVDDEYQTNFADLVKDISESVENDVLMKAAQIINRRDDLELRNNNLNENLAGQERIMYVDEIQMKNIYNESLTHGIKRDKKWSTFLMKPDIPTPQPTKFTEAKTEHNDGYKVVIKKQPRKIFVPPEKKVQFDQNVVEVQIIDEPSEEFSNPEITTEVNIENDFENEENIEYLEENNNNDDVEDYNDNVEDYNDNVELEEDPDRHKRNNSIDIKYKPISEIKIDDETSTTLEEQLITVQKQLQALSQLPSAIQLTLDAVSKQLASIVSAKEDSEEIIEDNGDEKNEENERQMQEELERIEEEESVSEGAEAEVYQENMEDTNSSLGEEFEEDIITEEIKAIMERSERGDATEDKNWDPSGDMTEEDMERKLIEEEARREEEERLAKKQKAMEERPKPFQRPIILPGGRKWSDPDDAIPIFKKPKMSEEKILETIENNLEPIAGNRKGINFLKYQPVPKNLDYLQRSDVYRLVHDMEPPVRGIVSRPEKIPAVQDYYEAMKGAQ